MYKNSEKYKQEILFKFDITKRAEIEERRKELSNKLYLSEIVELEKPEFGNSNLILAPVGSGKSHLIENVLIPKDYDKKILYLTSNTALKDSLCPVDDEARKALAEKGESICFFTSKNKNKYGDRNYSVHVMTYAEFGEKISAPTQTFTSDVGLVFCDEVHSLPTYYSYDKSPALKMAMYWLLTPRNDVQIFFFTATKENIEKFEEKNPGHFNLVKVFNYLDHPKIRKYVTRSTYYINHIDQLRPHLKSRIEYFNYHNVKALAFSSKITEQNKIKEIAIEEGYKPIVLWSINNSENMDEEQLKVRDVVLKTGMIPEPYNILIINGSMQEGWNLYDDNVELAILDTYDTTEQIQALGRIRKDIELVIKKDKNDDSKEMNIEIESSYLNTPLTAVQKRNLCDDLYLLDSQGRIKKWPTIKEYLVQSGYEIEDKYINVDKKRTWVSVITSRK